MSNTAKLTLEGKEYELPVVVGSENEKAIDITRLRAQTGYITLDTGYMNTGATRSAITYLDGEQGILRYRGIPIEDLAEKSTFVETSYLLLHGELPTQEQWKRFSNLLTYHSMIHEDMIRFFDGYPATAHPMAILSSMVCSLSAYYPESLNVFENMDMQSTRLLSKLRTIAAFSYKKSVGQPMMYPQNHLSYCANFLHMMFATPAERYEPDPDMVRALNILLILHADHEQNCSTSTVRLVGSSQANLFASVSAGICALWGPLHGGANQAVIEMLEEMQQTKLSCKEFVSQVKDKKAKVRLMGFGHRVYKNYDPRAKILKQMAQVILNKKGVNDPMLQLAQELEEAALSDPFFIERKLYPNVDFYSGLLYKAMGIPVNMFTVMFAIGRLPGWIAQCKEMMEDPENKIGRPRQIYTGPTERHYTALADRK
ncbi:MAG: citrate (Si)-synthase [Gammaproteobacteria bacterium RIFCSPLOWO2_02_FULL_61_13]|nr:MAG: citrate (Si)-synthase [Gammaproteobacteria bacterium RIFCSPLOWO2_02_FULL_61_13]